MNSLHPHDAALYTPHLAATGAFSAPWVDLEGRWCATDNQTAIRLAPRQAQTPTVHELRPDLAGCFPHRRHCLLECNFDPKAWLRVVPRKGTLMMHLAVDRIALGDGRIELPARDIEALVGDHEVYVDAVLLRRVLKTCAALVPEASLCFFGARRALVFHAGRAKVLLMPRTTP